MLDFTNLPTKKKAMEALMEANFLLFIMMNYIC